MMSFWRGRTGQTASAVGTHEVRARVHWVGACVIVIRWETDWDWRGYKNTDHTLALASAMRAHAPESRAPLDQGDPLPIN